MEPEKKFVEGQQDIPESGSLVKKLDKKNMKKTVSLFLIAFFVVAFGVLSGFLLSGRKKASGTAETSDKQKSEVVNTETEAGITTNNDEWDTVEGKLEEGGINGEGTHHLDRGTGPSKFVYLTSTVIDLQKFVGKDVTIWGETISGQEAGWLMDVVKIKVKN